MKPHAYQPDPDNRDSLMGDAPLCALCSESADHPIHELDAVPLGDAEDDLTPMTECGHCGEPSPMRFDADGHALDTCPHCHEQGFMHLAEKDADDPREDEDRDAERTGDRRNFEPPDDPDSGFDVREPATVSDLFHGYGRDLP